MRGDVHVRFGGRAGETERPRGRHRAPVRLYERHEALSDRAVVKGHRLRLVAAGR